MHKTGLVAACAALLAVACTASQGDLDARATAFVQALIEEPGNAEKLGRLAAAGPRLDPRTLVRGQRTHVLLAYLRARQRQGIPLGIKVTAHEALGADRRLLTVNVAEGEQGALQRRQPGYLLQLDFYRGASGDWQIARLQVPE